MCTQVGHDNSMVPFDFQGFECHILRAFGTTDTRWANTIWWSLLIFIWKGLSSLCSMPFDLKLSNQNFFLEKSLPWKSSNRWKGPGLPDFMMHIQYLSMSNIWYVYLDSLWLDQLLIFFTGSWQLDTVMMTFFHVCTNLSICNSYFV